MPRLAKYGDGMNKYIFLGLVLLLIGFGVVSYFKGGVIKEDIDAPVVLEGSVPITSQDDVLVKTTRADKAFPMPLSSLHKGYPKLDDYPKLVSFNLFDNQLVTAELKLNADLYGVLPADLDRPEQMLPALMELSGDGNGEASLGIAKLLEECSRMPRTEGDYQRARESLRTTGRIDGYNIIERGPFELGSEIYAAALESLDVNYAKCRSVVESQFEEIEQYKNKAMKQEAFSALTDYGIEQSDENPKASKRLFEKLWQMGDSSALSILSRMELTGHGAQDGKPDKVRGYAYALLGEKIYLYAEIQNGSPYAGSMESAIEGALRDMALELTADELERANQFAYELIQNNKNCCIGIWLTE